MGGYGFNNVYHELNVENILLKASESMLWRYYLGVDFQLRRNINSPLREDTTPSFSLYTDARDRIKFKDFGGERGDIFDFLCLRDALTFSEALVKVNSDFNLKLGTIAQQTYGGCVPVSKRQEKQLSKFEEEHSMRSDSSNFIQAFTRPYTSEDYEFWFKFGVSEFILREYHIHCAKAIKLNGTVIYNYHKDDPCYVYYFPRTKHIKCYFPLRKGNKRFLGNISNYEDIQGYDQCKVKQGGKDILILTKSMKDCMTLRALGYDAMAIHGEGQYFNKDFIRHIRKYYPRVISLYDRDRTGVKGARLLWKEYGIVPYFISKMLMGVKDISDVYEKIGKKKAEELMKDIISALDRQTK